MNRYAAAPVGQPGVFQAVISQPDLTWTSLIAGAAKSSTAEIVARATWGPLGQTVRTVSSPARSVISITASNNFLKKAAPVIQKKWNVIAQSGLGSANGQLHEATFEVAYRSANEASVRAAFADTNLKLPGGRWTIKVGVNHFDELVDIKRIPRYPGANSLKVGLVTDVALSIGFQLYNDSYDPFLTTGQRAGRVSVAGFGGVASASVGFGTASLAGVWLCGPGVAICASAAVIGVIGSTVTSYAWSHLQPYIFESLGLNPGRNLAPLN